MICFRALRSCSFFVSSIFKLFCKGTEEMIVISCWITMRAALWSLGRGGVGKLKYFRFCRIIWVERQKFFYGVCHMFTIYLPKKCFKFWGCLFSAGINFFFFLWYLGWIEYNGSLVLFFVAQKNGRLCNIIAVTAFYSIVKITAIIFFWFAYFAAFFVGFWYV